MKENFSGTELTVHETNDNKQWYMTVEEVAKGYGVTAVTIRRHLQEHGDEIREGVERSSVQNMNSRSKGGATQSREQTIIYREGAIKLGFFIRSKQAAAFRQWATNLVIRHMDQNGYTLNDLMTAFREQAAHTESRFNKIEGICGGLRDEVDELRATLQMIISDEDAEILRKEIREAKFELGVDGRSVVGYLKATLNVSHLYGGGDVRRAVNALRTLRGKGLKLIRNKDE